MASADYHIETYLGQLKAELAGLEGKPTGEGVVKEIIGLTIEKINDAHFLEQIASECNKKYAVGENAMLQRFWYRGTTEDNLPANNGDIRCEFGKRLDAAASEGTALSFPTDFQKNQYQALLVIDLDKIPGDRFGEYVDVIRADSQIKFPQGIPAGAYRVIKASELGYEKGKRIEANEITPHIGKAMLELIEAKR